ALHHSAPPASLATLAPYTTLFRSPGEIPLPLQRGTVDVVELAPQLLGDHVGEGGLAKAGRSGKEAVVQGLAPATRGPNVDLDLLQDPPLTDVLVEALWPQRRLRLPIHGIRVGVQLAPHRARNASLSSSWMLAPSATRFRAASARRSASAGL